MRYTDVRSEIRKIAWSFLWLCAIIAVIEVIKSVRKSKLADYEKSGEPRYRVWRQRLSIGHWMCWLSLRFADLVDAALPMPERITRFGFRWARARLLVETDSTHNKRHAYGVWISFAVLISLTITALIGRALNETLITRSPELLVWLSPSYDHTLRVASRMSIWMFMFVGVARRLVADPFWWYLGKTDTEGLEDSRWRPIRYLGRSIRAVESKIDALKHSERDILIWHFFTADMVNSYLLGHLGVSWKKILPVNLAGTILTVYLMYRVGDGLRTYIAVIDWISRIATAFIVLMTIRLLIKRYLRRWRNKR